jgi:hypothetical protein
MERRTGVSSGERTRPRVLDPASRRVELVKAVGKSASLPCKSRGEESSFRRDAETSTRGRVRYPELAPIRTFLHEPDP